MYVLTVQYVRVHVLVYISEETDKCRTVVSDGRRNDGKSTRSVKVEAASVRTSSLLWPACLASGRDMFFGLAGTGCTTSSRHTSDSISDSTIAGGTELCAVVDRSDRCDLLQVRAHIHVHTQCSRAHRLEKQHVLQGEQCAVTRFPVERRAGAGAGAGRGGCSGRRVAAGRESHEQREQWREQRATGSVAVARAQVSAEYTERLRRRLPHRRCHLKEVAVATESFTEK